MSRTNRLRPALDLLEDRRNPAGNVAASLSGEVLQIRGDEAGNQVRISQTDGGQIKVIGLDGTRINGRSQVVFDADGIEKLDSLLFGGNDRLEVNRLRASTDQNMEMGAGNDVVVLTGARAGVNLTVKTDDGNDVVRANGVITGSDFNIETGQGTSVVEVLDTQVGGTLNVIGQDSADAVTVAGGTTIGKDLKVNSGKGNDTVAVRNTDVTLSMTLTTDEGADVVAVSGVTTGEDLKIEAGKGRPAVGMNRAVLLDSGVDRLTAGNTRVTSDLLFDGGDEFDTLDRNAGVTAGQDFEVKGFERFV
jgi:hypothetical protein